MAGPEHTDRARDGEGVQSQPGRRARRRSLGVLGALAVGGVAVLLIQSLTGSPSTVAGANADATVAPTAASAGQVALSDTSSADTTHEEAAAHEKLLAEGKQTFRFDTFGSEKFWGDGLNLDAAIAGEANGGVGPGVSPKTALAVGLKVDVDALPTEVQDAVKQGKVDLDDPATTLTLLKLDSVVGVKGLFSPEGNLQSVGIECALCHSTVDDSFAPGIGKRQDGWANRDLNVGAIVGLAPNLQPVATFLGVDVPTVQKVLSTWGPGRYDAQLFLDGKAFRPDGKSASSLIPPAFGLLGVNQSTSTGWGSITYWNAFVANLQMHGEGTFYDPRLDNKKQFPVAARNKSGHTTAKDDKITSKLGALQAYQLSIQAPKPPASTFDAAAAKKGEALFNGQAECSTCHVPPLFTEPGFNMHTGKEIGIDNFQADRSPTRMYRTAPLAGLWTHQKGGFYHDGRFSDLQAVVDHYDKTFKLGLTSAQKNDLVQYLLSL